MNNELAYQKLDELQRNVANVIKDKEKQIKYVVTCLIAGGHILMEDNPGTGKTVLAKTLAKSISAQESDTPVFKRIQFTPDLLPLDLVGSYIFNDDTKEFVFHRGPLFTKILLADEINRASPKVQSALLECMAENQITLGNTTFQLDKLFFTIATQNPIEMEGTYPLPAAQLDRFSMKIQFGYIDRSNEIELYKHYREVENNQLDTRPVLSDQDILDIRKLSYDVQVHDEIIASVTNIVRNTREHTGIILGASPRAGITLMKCLRAYAMINHRDFVTEDDLKIVSFPVLEHRLVFRNQDAKRSALNDIIDQEIKRLSNIKMN